MDFLTPSPFLSTSINSTSPLSLSFFLLACTSQLQRCLGSGEFIGLMSPTGKFCAEMTGPCDVDVDVVVVVVVVVSRFPFVVVAAVVLGCSELKHDKHIQK